MKDVDGTLIKERKLKILVFFNLRCGVWLNIKILVSKLETSYFPIVIGRLVGKY